jgi:hypothetical protein
MKHGFQRISQSLIEMAVITAVLIRVLHIVFIIHGGARPDWHSFFGTFVLLPILLLAMATVHLSNYPVKEWLWRAPVFALAEAVAEAATSLVLIELGRERWGTVRAEIGDWPSMAGTILAVRFVIVCLFVLVLGLIVQAVRRREFSTVEGRHYHHHEEAPDETEHQKQG